MLQLRLAAALEVLDASVGREPDLQLNRQLLNITLLSDADTALSDNPSAH